MANEEDFKGQRDWRLGSNNISEADSLPPQFAVGAINYDYTNQGNLRLRAGYQKLVNLADVRGAVAYGDNLLLASGTDLVLFDTESNTPRVIGELPPAGFFAGAELNGEAYLATPTGRLRVRGEEVLPWGLDPVNMQVTVGAGRLPAGQYRIAVTGVTEDGIESGAVPLVLTLDEGSSVTVTWAAPQGAVFTRLYSTVDNGDTLYLQDTKASGVYVLDTLRSDTARLLTENMAPPPIGDQIVVHGDRLLIVYQNFLFTTEPFSPHLYNQVSGWVAYGAPIDVAQPSGSTIFVAADRTYALQGLGTPNQRNPAVRNFGALRGSGVALPDGRATWMTKYGQAYGSADGTVELPNRTSYAPPVAERGSSGVLEHLGEQLVVTTLQGKVNGSTLGFNDFYEAEFLP